MRQLAPLVVCVVGVGAATAIGMTTRGRRAGTTSGHPRAVRRAAGGPAVRFVKLGFNVEFLSRNGGWLRKRPAPAAYHPSDISRQPEGSHVFMWR